MTSDYTRSVQVSRKVHEQMHKHGVTVKDVAEATQLSKATIYMVRSQNPNATRKDSTLAAISKAIGWKAHHLPNLVHGRPANTPLKPEAKATRSTQSRTRGPKETELAERRVGGPLKQQMLDMKEELAALRQRVAELEQLTRESHGGMTYLFKEFDLSHEPEGKTNGSQGTAANNGHAGAGNRRRVAGRAGHTK